MKTSRNLEAMTWGDFQELFMSKFFPASAQHGKAREFLELKQGAMTVMEYVAKFTKLACFGDDYGATYMAKVRNVTPQIPGVPLTTVNLRKRDPYASKNGHIGPYIHTRQNVYFIQK